MTNFSIDKFTESGLLKEFFIKGILDRNMCSLNLFSDSLNSWLPDKDGGSIIATLQNCANEIPNKTLQQYRADTIFLPNEEFSYIGRTRMLTSSDTTILEYFQDQSGIKIVPCNILKDIIIIMNLKEIIETNFRIHSRSHEMIIAKVFKNREKND